MTSRCSRQELVLVAIALAMGFWLRAAHTEQLAVEHFDEGIYSSVTWYDSLFGESYPMRHLYAPPLLPTAISTFDAAPALKQVAPFVLSILLGGLTVGVVWWLSRSMFGLSAGLFCVFVAAFSDVHILFSRMALTDAPALFWISLSVGLGVRAIHSGSTRQMIASGVMCGIAWWTKYTGWLPIAIVVSGSAFWWILRGRKTVPAPQLIKLWLIMAVSAFVVWSPWLLMLQDHGGYAAVAKNHKGYLIGFDGWQGRLGHHIAYFFNLESWFGAAAIGVGLLAAGSRRWIELKYSSVDDKLAQKETADKTPAERLAQFPSTTSLRRFVVGAIVLFVIGTGIGTLGLLTCIGIGGLAGTFLWPVSRELFDRSTTKDTSPATDSGHKFFAADFSASASIDPVLGASIVLAWFCGMLLTTPMYHPYPRLALPLLVSIWLASAAGIAWWIEAILNVERRDEEAGMSRTNTVLKRVTLLMMGAAVGLTLMQAGQLTPSTIWQSRTSLKDASWKIAETVLADAAGEFEKPKTGLNLDDLGQITPEPPEADDDKKPQADAGASSVWDKVVGPADTSVALADLQNPKCIVYAFGEPGVLRYLNSAGIVGGPVQDLQISEYQDATKSLPTYMLLGPNALRTPGMFDSWATNQQRFTHVCDVHYLVSDVVAYNLFTPLWVAQHPEARVQKLELYRVR